MRSFGLARLSLAACVCGLVTLPARLPAQGAAKTNQYGNPATLKPAPTKAAIDVRDLQIRLYQFADDSMLGRQVGRVGNKKGTDMIAAEVKRLGLLPAGDNGTYFQTLPYHLRKFTNHSRLTVDGNPLVWNTDFVAVPGQRAPRPITGAEVVFGGTQGDSTTQISAAEKSAFLATPSIIPASPAGLSLTRIMSQKYLAQWGWGHNEIWMDMRRYNYTDVDPASGVQVFPGFTLPTNLYPDNGGKIAQRIRPRFNSEYVWNRPGLEAIGGLALDYHTKPLWITQP